MKAKDPMRIAEKNWESGTISKVTDRCKGIIVSLDSINNKAIDLYAAAQNMKKEEACYAYGTLVQIKTITGV